MKKMMKTVLLLLTAGILLNLSGCKEEEKQESKTEYHMYYLYGNCFGRNGLCAFPADFGGYGK